MMYKEGEVPGGDKDSNEAACGILGHMPEDEVKPASFAEMGRMESVIKCARCGVKLA